VMKPGELPVEDALAKAGLKLAKEDEKYVDAGFDVAPVFGGSNARVNRTRPFAESAGLAANDILLEVNGESVVGSNAGESAGKANTAIRKIKADEEYTVKIRREGQEKELTLKAAWATRTTFKILDDGSKDPKKLALRKGWFFAGKR